MKKTILLLVIAFALFAQIDELNIDVGEMLEKSADKTRSESTQATLDSLTKVIEEYGSDNPDAASAFEARADLRMEIGDNLNASFDYDKAIELIGKNNVVAAPIYLKSGNNDREIGFTVAAIKNFTSAIKLFDDDNPEKAFAYNNRAFANLHMEYYNGAVDDFTKAIEILGDEHPMSADLYCNRAIAKSYGDDRKSMIEDFNKAYAIDPENPQVVYNTALVLSSGGGYEPAIDLYSRAIELFGEDNPDAANAYLNRGVAKANLEEYEDAIDDFEKTIELNPELESAKENLELAKEKLEETEHKESGGEGTSDEN